MELHASECPALDSEELPRDDTSRTHMGSSCSYTVKNDNFSQLATPVKGSATEMPSPKKDNKGSTGSGLLPVRRSVRRSGRIEKRDPQKKRCVCCDDAGSKIEEDAFDYTSKNSTAKKKKTEISFESQENENHCSRTAMMYPKFLLVVLKKGDMKIKPVEMDKPNLYLDSQSTKHTFAHELDTHELVTVKDSEPDANQKITETYSSVVNIAAAKYSAISTARRLVEVPNTSHDIITLDKVEPSETNRSDNVARKTTSREGPDELHASECPALDPEEPPRDDTSGTHMGSSCSYTVKNDNFRQLATPVKGSAPATEMLPPKKNNKCSTGSGLLPVRRSVRRSGRIEKRDPQKKRCVCSRTGMMCPKAQQVVLKKGEMNIIKPVEMDKAKFLWILNLQKTWT